MTKSDAPSFLRNANWTIGKKIALGFGIFVVLIVVLSLTAYLNLRAIDRQINSLLLQSEITQAFHDVQLGFFIAREGEADYLATQSPLALSQLNQGQLLWRSGLARLSDLPLSAQEEEYRIDLNQQLEAAEAAFTQLVRYVDAGDMDRAFTFHRTEIEEIADNFIDFFDDNVRPSRVQNRADARNAATQTVNTSLLVIGAVTLGALVLGVISSTSVGRGIANPIHRLTEVAQQVAGGDLNAPIDVESRDEVGALAQAFQTMTGNLKDLLASLERRGSELEARTEELEANQRAIQVVFSAGGAFGVDELLSMVVNLIRDRFNLYHVQMYLLDDAGENAILKQSTGFAGQQLLARKHAIPMERTSLVTSAIKEGESVLVPDVKEDPNFLANPLLPDTRSELVVPLKVNDQTVGALDIQSREAGVFTEDAISLYETMVGQIGLMFQNAQLFTDISEKTESLTVFTTQLATAAEIGRRISTILDPENLLNEVVELLRSRFGFYHAHIYLLDDAKQNLVVRAGSGEVGRVLKERGHAIPLEREHSLVARAARERVVQTVMDTALESDFFPNPLLPQTRSELAVPLVVGNNVLGVLDIQDDLPERFGPAERDTFATLAGQVATALENARLFTQQEAIQTEIRSLARRNQLVLDSAAEGIYGVDQHGVTVFINPAALKMLGYAEEELLGGVARGPVDLE